MTDVEEGDLLERAASVRTHAHAPYSRFAVGAALRADGGETFTGVNVESAALPAGLCAERVALGAAVTAGHRAFTTLAVAGPGPAPVPPCGICRQALAEFGVGLVVVAAGEEGQAARWTLAQLLPEAFTGEHLGRNQSDKRG